MFWLLALLQDQKHYQGILLRDRDHSSLGEPQENKPKTTQQSSRTRYSLSILTKQNVLGDPEAADRKGWAPGSQAAHTNH